MAGTLDFRPDPCEYEYMANFPSLFAAIDVIYHERNIDGSHVCVIDVMHDSFFDRQDICDSSILRGS